MLLRSYNYNRYKILNDGIGHDYMILIEKYVLIYFIS